MQKLLKQLKVTCYNENITSANFPDKSRKGFGPVELMKIDTEMTNKKIEEKIKADGYVPVNSYELLEWAVKNWNSKDWVIALGSKWRDAYGYPQALHLWGGADGRRLDLSGCRPSSRWCRCCLFARRKCLKLSDSSDSSDLELRILELEKFREKVEKIINL